MDIRLVGITLQEAIDMIEEGHGDDVDRIYIEPPDPQEVSDQDSADEDSGGLVDNLSSRQLRAQAEVVVRGHTAEDAEAEAEDDPEPPSTAEPARKILKRTTKPATSAIPAGEKEKSKNSVSDPAPARPKKAQKSTPSVWKQEDLPERSEMFPNANTALYRDKTAVDIFELFFNDEIISLLVNECNNYAKYKNDSSFVDVSREEMLLWLSIVIMSGYNVVPTKRSYWEDKGDVNNSLAAASMRRNRFLDICRYMHLADNTKPDLNDKMWKVRPLLEKFQEIFKTLYIPEKHLSYDEAMIRYFGKHSCKQFIRGKPVRFGYKVWCLNTPRGYLVDFEVYQGKSLYCNNEYETRFGKCSAPLLSIIDRLPENVKSLPTNFYFDNLFTGFPLLVELKQRGYGSTGTMRENRIPKDCPLASKEHMSRDPRGTFHFSKDESHGILVSKWKDNSVVTVASTAYGIHPVKQVSRYSKTEKKRVTVPRPNVFGKYNESMGGTDRMDQNVACHRIATRNRKWWWSIFTWILDVAITNAWILSFHTGQAMSQLDLRRQVVQTYLIRYGKPAQSGRRVHVGLEAHGMLRYDGLHHYVAPIDGGKRRRCQGEICSSVVSTECLKCNVGLCIKCFASYHTL